MVLKLASEKIEVRREGSLGHLVLNRPRAINAIDLEMVEALDSTLAAWETDPDVDRVLLTGAGERGLCSGGDIVMVREAAEAGEPERARAFWRAEYLLDFRIARYPKPFVVAMDGVVMGGGVGLAAHASHRLATERLRLAMPEVGIGLHPDCGAAFLLARAPGELGTHLVLTGRSVGAADAALCGLVDRLLPASALAELPALLREGGVEEAIARASSPAPAAEGAGGLAGDRAWIDAAYRLDSVEEIIAALWAREEDAAHAAAAEIETRSPTSLKVSFEALRRARRMPALEHCLEQDYRVSTGCLADHDLMEGIRAQVVDKDREPRWRPATLAAVGEAEVARHFRQVPDELGLAPRTPSEQAAASPPTMISRVDAGTPVASSASATGSRKPR
jgi:enoyl-CoA hydratase